MFWLPNWSEMRSDAFLLGWNLGGLVSVLLPLLMLSISRMVVVGDGEGGNDNNNNGDNNNRRWWQWRNRNDNGDGGGGEDGNVPWWWFNRNSGDPEEEGKGALIFVYILALVLFIGLTLHGNFAIRRNNAPDSTGFQAALFMFTYMAFLLMILVAGSGLIEVEGRALEENGWYGQFSVCFFITCLIWWIHGMFYSWCLRKRRTSRPAVASQEDTTVSNYNAPWDCGSSERSSTNKNNSSWFFASGDV